MFYMCTFCNVTITSIIGYDNRVSERTLVVSRHHLYDLYQSKLTDIHKIVHVMTITIFTKEITIAMKNNYFQTVNSSSKCLINLGHTFWLRLVVYQAKTFLLSTVFKLGRK